MAYLRTNTATRITVGPFIGVDGLTPQTSLTVTSEHLTFVVDTGGVPTLVLDSTPTASGGANDLVHITGDDAGYYDLELAAANVNYLGRARLSLNNLSAHAPVFHEFMILPAMVYDSMVLGTDRLDTNVTHAADVAWESGAIVAAAVASDARVVVQALVVAGMDETIPDSVPAVGVRPSVRQALYLIGQDVTNRRIDSGFYYIYKPDGSLLITGVLDDSGTPKSVTRIA